MLGSLPPHCEQEKRREPGGEPPVQNPAAVFFHPWLQDGRALGKMQVQGLLAQNTENTTKDPELCMFFFLLYLLCHFICYLMSF